MKKPSYIAILTLALCISCGENKEVANKSASPRVKKSTKIESPSQNEEFVRGASIPMLFSSSGAEIDSVVLTVDDRESKYSTSSFEINLPSRKVGSWSIRAKVYCAGESETHYRKVVVLPESAPTEMTYTVVNTFPHDVDDFTQGLLILDGVLYESTGQRGESTFKQKDLLTGEASKVVNLADDLFGEGLAFYKNEFYQLTWTSGQGFVYNREMEEIRKFSYPMQGWGLTTYGDQLILTDESEKLYFIEPSSFTVQSELQVYDHEGKIDALNELELIDGKLWANIFLTDDVVIIDPETGEVLHRIDFSGLLTSQESSAADVLNGIAVDPDTGKIYVTGKDWPKLFEITIQEKTI